MCAERPPCAVRKSASTRHRCWPSKKRQRLKRRPANEISSVTCIVGWWKSVWCAKRTCCIGNFCIQLMNCRRDCTHGSWNWATIAIRIQRMAARKRIWCYRVGNRIHQKIFLSIESWLKWNVCVCVKKVLACIAGFCLVWLDLMMWWPTKTEEMKWLWWILNWIEVWIKERQRELTERTLLK